MNVDMNTLKMIKEIADAPGAPGFEDEVVNVARKYAADIGRMDEDFLRNLYIVRKENRGDRPMIMLDAHSDEVAFMVHSVKPSGCLRFVLLGAWNKSSLLGTKVRVRNADGEYIPGIIAAKPSHFMSAAEKNSAVTDVSNMVIDIGATSREDALKNFRIRIGEPIVADTKLEYDEKRDLMFAKGFDCRIGCAAMIEALRRLDGEELSCDVTAVMSSQEELGCRSSKANVGRIRPDIAIVLEGCPADDTFTEAYAVQTALRKGPMFRHMDTSVICAPRFQRWTLNLAAEKGIPVQESVREGGGNNAAPIQQSPFGAPAVVAGIPVRYSHTPNCISTYYDFEMTVRLVMEMLRNITPEMIRGL